MPDPRSYELSDSELLAEFTRPGGVRDFVFGGTTAQDSPRMILLGAQPAAGKSQAMAGIQQRYGPDVVPLTGDHLRVFHPRYEEMMRTLSPEQAELATGQASGRWVRMSLDYARDNGYGLILEGVFRDPDTTLGTAEEFSTAGFTTELVAVAVREERSRLDGVYRYLSSGDEPGRWTPPDRHDLAYGMMRETVARAEASPHVYRIMVTNRSGAELYANERDPDGQWRKSPAAVVAVDTERAQPFTPVEALLWQSRYRDVLLTMAARDEVTDISRPVLQQLSRDADTVARMIDPDPGSATRREHEAVRPLLQALADGARPGPDSRESLMLTPTGQLLREDASLFAQAEADRRTAMPADLRHAEEELRMQLHDRIQAVAATRPYREVPDADLAAALAYTVDEAAAARRQAERADARAAEIAAELAPGGEVEQRAAASARRVDAILQAQNDAALVPQLAADVERGRQQVDEVEQRLAERGLFGRPVERGADRDALEQRLDDLRVTVAEREERLAFVRERLEANSVLAGPVGEHDAVLTAWHQAGGSPAEALARATAARERGMSAALSEASAAHQRAADLDSAAGRIRVEIGRREAQPPAQRAAEDAQRVQAVQRAAQQQTHQYGQPGRGRGQGRSGPSR